MKLSLNEALQKGYNKVYFSFDCIGDTIILMSALEYLFHINGKKLLVGTYYPEIFDNCPYTDILDGFCEENITMQSFSQLECCGLFPVFITATDFVSVDGRFVPRWGKNHILVDVCNKLGVTGDIQVQTKMFLSDEEKTYGRFFPDNQIAITGGGWQKYKTIPKDVIQTVVSKLKGQYNFVQVGHVSDPLLEGVLDKRAEGKLRETASILYNSDMLVCGIGGMMHMARAVNCRAVVGFTYAEPLSLEQYACNINVFTEFPACKKCGKRQEFPYLVKCRDNFSCISGISADNLCDAIQKQMRNKNKPLEFHVVTAMPNPVLGIEEYLKRFGKIVQK